MSIAGLREELPQTAELRMVQQEPGDHSSKEHRVVTGGQRPRKSGSNGTFLPCHG